MHKQIFISALRVFFAVTLLFFFVFGCRNKNPNADLNVFLDKEIKNRREILKKFNQSQDTLQIEVSEIAQEVNTLILLSKDIENLSACVNKGNSYFKEQSTRFGVNTGDYLPLNTQMHINEMESVLKQNELHLLNLLVFKTNSSEIAPSSAQ